MATEGQGLRQQLEAALEENTALKAQVSEFAVATVAAKPAFSLVGMKDLEGVELDKLEEVATTLQTERLEQQRTLLAKAGLDDDHIDRVLAGEALQSSDGLDPGVADLVNSQGDTGQVPPRVDRNSKHGRAAIKAHFAEEAAS